jgi:hypothetical protein
MRNRPLFLIGLAALALVLFASAATARARGQQPANTLVETVRRETARFKELPAAEAAGYGLFHGCVSGPEVGAMGVHYVNGGLVGDGAVDAARPEALLYEQRDGRLRLVGVEYVVIAADWDAAHAAPPTLMGQLFHYVGSPNRYGIPAFYELHVWAWKQNTLGVFADWNPRVSCEEFAGDPALHAEGH